MVKLIAEKVSAWRRYRASVRELSRLTDRELADLGLTRSDIEPVARQVAGFLVFKSGQVSSPHPCPDFQAPAGPSPGGRFLLPA